MVTFPKQYNSPCSKTNLTLLRCFLYFVTIDLNFFSEIKHDFFERSEMFTLTEFSDLNLGLESLCRTVNHKNHMALSLPRVLRK